MSFSDFTTLVEIYRFKKKSCNHLIISSKNHLLKGGNIRLSNNKFSLGAKKNLRLPHFSGLDNKKMCRVLRWYILLKFSERRLVIKTVL